MGSSRAIASVLAAALVVAPVLSGAQPAPTPQQKKEAGELVKKAITKSQAGDHEAAIDLYKQAYAIIPQPLLLSNIGSEFQHAQKPVEALTYFCKYLDEDPTGTNASYATAQAKALQIEQGNQVDDKNPCKPIVKPTNNGSGDAGSGSGSASGSGDTGGSGSGAQVTGTTGIDHATSTPADQGGGKGLFYTGLVVTGVGVLAAGIGGYYGLQAKKISDSISSHKVTDPWPADIKAQEAEGQSDEDKQVMFMIGGGVALVTGVVLTVIGAGKKSSSTEKSVTLAPTASPSSFGLALSGGF